MAEIRAISSNGYRAISTFSGCGGSCLGYRMAGFSLLWASEFIPAAQETHAANHPETILDKRDIRLVSGDQILEAIHLQKGELDLMDGSPPCSSFSTAGKRESGWGKVKKYSDKAQRTDDLFFEYVRLLDDLKPKTFVAENVSGLVKGTAKGYFLEILSALKGCGYRVACKVLDAQWLGVPQSRQRTIFVGVRNDLGILPAHPSPLPYRYSVRDAIPWIRSVSCLLAGKEPGARDSGRPCPTVTTRDTGGAGGHWVESETDISRFAIGSEYEKLSLGEASSRYFNLIRVDPDRPSPTVCQSHGNPSAASITHPFERRKFSIAELKRICAFPDDFVLTGTYAQQWERLGRAVPPVMMYHIAKTVRDEVLAKCVTR